MIMKTDQYHSRTGQCAENCYKERKSYIVELSKQIESREQYYIQRIYFQTNQFSKQCQ